MAYRLLALDMDGTLLTSDKRVSARTREALFDLSERGVSVAYCTGRCTVELMDFPRELPFIRYGVLTSGALSYDFAHGCVLDAHPLSREVVAEVMRIAAIEHPMVHVLGTVGSYASPRDVARLEEVGMGVYRPMYERVCTLVDDMGAWAREHPLEVMKLNLYHTSPRSRARTRERIRSAKLPLELVDAETTSLECTAPGVSKGEGIRSLSAHLGIDLADVVAIGDAENDRASLSAVGMPVAMGNAPDAIKALCRLVVADNDHDGIVEAIAALF